MKMSLALLVAFAALLPAASHAAPPLYRLKDLGAVPEDTIIFTGKGLDLNAKGHIAGASNANPDVIAQIVIPGDGVIDTNATLGGDRSVGNAINGADHLAGDSITANGDLHAFFWNGIDMIDLGTLGGKTSSALAISNLDQITGGSDTESGEFHAFFWDGATMHDIGTLGGRFSDGRGISRNGFVTGLSTVSDDPNEFHAFLWDEDFIEDLGTLGGERSSGESVNVHGMVAGQSSLADGSEHAMLWNGTQMIDLGTLDGHQFSIAHWINADAIVVGSSSTQLGDDVTAFVWHDGVMSALPSPYEFTEAWFVNSKGAIFGFASDVSAGPHILKWDPITKEVEIDIKPSSRVNRINPNANGYIRVAILSETNAGSTFDPISEVNISTAQFGPGGARAARHTVRDVNRDGLGDLLLQFRLRQTGISCGDDDSMLVAKTLSGELFAGTDSLQTVGCQ